MTETESQTPLNTGNIASEQRSEARIRCLLRRLRSKYDRLHAHFDWDFWQSLYRRSFLFTKFVRKQRLNQSPALAVDMIERNKDYKVIADLSGIEEKEGKEGKEGKEVHVRLVYGCMSIKGEKLEKNAEKKKNYYLHERYFGSFEQSYAMPDEVDIDKIKTSFKKRLLIITLPKKSADVTIEKNIKINLA